MSSRSNSSDPNSPEVSLTDFEDTLDLDFEAIFVDAVADIVRHKGGPQPQPKGKAEITQILQRTLALAMSSKRPPVKLNVRKLQEPNLDSLFLNLSPLQLEEPQAERPGTSSLKVKPAEVVAPEVIAPDVPPQDITSVDTTLPESPALISPEATTQPLTPEATTELSWPALELDEVDLPDLVSADQLPLPQTVTDQDSIGAQPSHSVLFNSQPPTLTPPTSEAPNLKISAPKSPDPELAQLESFLGVAGFRFSSVELSDIELPELGLTENAAPPTPETSSPTYPFPNCPLSVATQLQDAQSLIGDLVTQDNYLAQQHQELHSALQMMLGTMIDTDSPHLADCVGSVRQLKAQIQRTQKTLRQQRQTLQQLHSSWYDIQMLPLRDLFQPLAGWGSQLMAGQKRSVQDHPLPSITFEFSGGETLIDQRLFLRLRQPLTELFRHFFLQIFRTSSQETPIQPQQVQFHLCGYAWGQQVWIELRHPGTPLELESYLFQLNTQIQALHGTVHHAHMGEATTLTLRLPRFLPISQILLVKVEEQLLAFPLNTLTQVITVAADDLVWQQGKPYYQLPQALVPVYPLKQCLQLATKETFESPTNFLEKVNLICVGFEDRQVALQVDELLQEQELTVRPSTSLNKAQTPNYVCGYGLLNEDKLVPILDPAPLLERLEKYFSI
jgi:FtsZ-binding cell division protein ZapB